MPTSVELLDPYLLGLTPNGVEVRTMDKVSRLVQLVELQKATHMCQGASLFVASPSSCWVLQPVPIDLQVDSLVAAEDFAAASKLAVRFGFVSLGMAWEHKFADGRVESRGLGDEGCGGRIGNPNRAKSEAVNGTQECCGDKKEEE